MNGRLTEAIRHLAADEPVADAELLGAFVRGRDPAAFEQIVRRHGPLVLGVCRRVLGRHDAEDAFQATFLVLARRAAAVVPRDRLAGWLYGVAYRTALEARRMAARRRAREAPLTESVQPAAPAEEPTADLSALLDGELSRLPDRLRLPVVLCDLEGRTRRQVARQLGIPDGTLSNRLAAARRLLAKRLTNRGVGIPAAAVAAFLTDRGLSSVPPELLAATVRSATASMAAAVTALTREVEKAMFLTKLKVLATVVVAATLTVGVGAWTGRDVAAGPSPKAKEPPPTTRTPPATAEHKAVLKKAAEAAQAIEAPDEPALFQKVSRLTTVGYEQARYGDPDGAATTFATAIKLADGLKSEATKSEAIANIGFYQAHGGLIADAQKTAESISMKSEDQTQEYRGRVLSEVASALAESGKLAEAVRAAESIPERVLKIPDKNGKEVEHRDAGRRDYALKLVADAQAKAGDVAGAVATARKIKDEGRRLYRLGELVIEYGKAGDEAAARKLFDEVRKDMEASKVGRWGHEIGMLRAAVGDAAGAVAWAEKIESPQDRADALVGISIGLAYREQWKK